MKLNTDGVAISILILILMILTCHTMNYLFPKNRYTMNNNMNNIMNNSASMNNNMNNSIRINSNINNTMSNKNEKKSLNNFLNIPTNTNYNKIYYQNSNTISSCNNVEHANIPCKKICNAEEDYALSDSELAFLYKYAYEEAGKEILMRKLNGEELE